MLNTINKQFFSYNCPFCFLGSHNVRINNKKKIVLNKCSKLSENSKKFTLKSKPLIKGKIVTLTQAIKEIRRLLGSTDQVHVDGLGCEQRTVYKILNFAEKNKFSFDHMHSQSISNFFRSLNSVGGSLTSFNELRNRSDFLLFVDTNEKEIFPEVFVKKLGWTKKKLLKSVFFLSEKKTTRNQFKHHYVDSNSSLLDELNFFKKLVYENKGTTKKFEYFFNSYMSSKYPVIIPKIKSDNYPLVLATFSIVKSLNNFKRTKLFNFYGLDNSAGLVNASVIKTGFPHAVSFTDLGPFYDPIEFNSLKLSRWKDLQIFISNFDLEPKINFFKKNIFIGHPSVKNKNLFDVFIPTKTPGLDDEGIIVRPDSTSILKLTKIVESDYMTTNKIFNLINE